MLFRGASDELRAAMDRLVELAGKRSELDEQQRLIQVLRSSSRLAAVRPLVWAWACSAQAGRPQRRWSFRRPPAPDEATTTADAALGALSELLGRALPRQYTPLDQELRAGGYGAVTAATWWQLDAHSILAALPESEPLRTTGLMISCCHPSGHVREAALRELSRGPLPVVLPILLVRANDWVRQVRAVAYARLLRLDASDVDVLAPNLELVERLAAQGRREPGAVDHLLNLLRSDPGLRALHECLSADSHSLRRAAFRFSWDAGGDREAIVTAALDSHDPFVRRWVVSKLEGARRVDRLRTLAHDRVPMVAEAALDALDAHVEPADRALLEALRRAPSASVQLTARYMLEKHFGESDHRAVYLELLEAADDRGRMAAAVGLTATGRAEDCEALLRQRLSSGPRARRRLLSAAASLDFERAREALHDDLAHPRSSVGKTARLLLAEKLSDADEPTLRALLEHERAHVRRNALLLTGRLGHWTALPLILRAHRDAARENVALAQHVLATWLGRHAYGVYRPPEASAHQARRARAALAESKGVLDEDVREALEALVPEAPPPSQAR